MNTMNKSIAQYAEIISFIREMRLDGYTEQQIDNTLEEMQVARNAMTGYGMQEIQETLWAMIV